MRHVKEATKSFRGFLQKSESQRRWSHGSSRRLILFESLGGHGPSGPAAALSWCGNVSKFKVSGHNLSRSNGGGATATGGITSSSNDGILPRLRR